jgi:hypothetical protein
MVGLRVFDVGALIVWMVWFFKLRDDDDEPSDGEDFRRGGADEPSDPRPPTGPPDLELPRPDADPWPARRRGHEGDRAPATLPARRAPAPRPPVRPRRAPAG